MTVNVQEDNKENTLQQEKVEENSKQLPQENKSTETNQEDPNWRAFREARKKDRLEREAAERKAAEKEAEVAALKAAMEAAFSKSAPTPQAYQQYYGIQPNEQPEETEDERIEKKVLAAIASREAAAEKERIERERIEYPNRLVKSYPNFNDVISQENLDYLDYHFPEVSRPLKRLPDGFEKWEDIYKAIIKFVPNNTNAKKEAAKAEANFNKPRSISSTGITQPGESSRESMRDIEARRAERYREMQRIMNKVG